MPTDEVGIRLVEDMPILRPHEASPVPPLEPEPDMTGNAKRTVPLAALPYGRRAPDREPARKLLNFPGTFKNETAGNAHRTILLRGYITAPAIRFE